jgi:phenylacetate-CoA ligase
MIVVRGVNVYPSSVDAIVRGFDEILEYQVIHQKKGDMSEVSLRVDAPEKVAQVLEVALKEAFSLRMPVSCVPAGSLPKFEMKARRWLTEE